MVRLRGRGPRGERLVGFVPHGHWKTIPLVAGLRHDEPFPGCGEESGRFCVPSPKRVGNYLPAYSPDLNPIEQVFSKLKVPRKAAERNA